MKREHIVEWATWRTWDYPPERTRLGIFEPGWLTDPIQNMYLQQTYVGCCADAYVLPHRLSQMHGNRPWVYLEASGLTMSELLSGDHDQCWVARFDQLPSNAVVAPLAEMNGDWVSWEGTPAEYVIMWGRIRELAGDWAGLWAWCPATLTAGWEPYEPDDYDIFGPSVYDHHGSLSAGYVAEHTASAGLKLCRPTVLAQTGSPSDDPVQDEQWLRELLDVADYSPHLTDVIYFNSGQYAMPTATIESIARERKGCDG